MNGYNFTERVRKVLAMAREEAERLRHEYVGTEHILLGLIREGAGVAAEVLKNMNADLDKIRRTIEAIVTSGKAAALTGPDLPYTSRSKKVLELSMAEARDLGHNYVGTEHLLLGLIREEKGIAAQVLTDAGITLDPVRAETLRLLATDGVNARSSVTEVTTMFPAGLDALVAAPDYHKLLLENEYVRVLETTIPPGATTPVHTHHWAAAHYVLSWSQFVRRDESGTVLLDTRQTDFGSEHATGTMGCGSSSAHGRERRPQFSRLSVSR